MPALLEANRELVAVGARFDRATDIAARNRRGRIGVIDSNIDGVLGRKQIGERRIDDRRAELGRYRGERALRSLACFDTFDGADVDELEGRLGAKAAAAAGVDPGRQRLAWLDESPNACWWGGLGRRNGCGAWSSAGGRRLAGGRLSHELPSRSSPGQLSGGAGSVETDLASRRSPLPLLQATPPTAGCTGTGPPSNAWATPGAIPMAASMASPRKTRRRLAR